VKRRIVFIIILFVGLAVYANSFHNEFIWDDLLIITPSEFIRDWKYLPQVFMTDAHHFSRDESNFYRPMQIFSYMIDYTFWKYQPFGYHLTSTLLHVVNAFLIYLIGLAVMDRLKKQKGRYIQWLALAAALVWLTHPVHAQNTTYISGRADVLAAGFMLLMIYSFLNFKRKVYSYVFFILALCSKEYAVIAFVFIILCDRFLTDKPSWRKYIPYALILCVYILARLTIFNFPTVFTTELIPGLYSRSLTSARSVAQMLGVVAYPMNLSMTRNIPWETSLFEPKVFASFIFLLCMGAWAIQSRKTNPFVSFCLAWFFIGYLPVANIIPMNANASEHWMYFPSIGLILLVVNLIYELISRRNVKFFVCLMGLLVAFYGVRLYFRNQDFLNEIVFYEKTLKDKPNNAKLYYNLGTAYGQKGDYQKAADYLIKAIQHDAKYAEAYGNLGLVYYRTGHAQKAIELYEMANTLEDDMIENNSNLGMVYADLGQLDKAMAAYQRAITLNPNHSAALNGVGTIHGKQGNYEIAEMFFEKALAIDPNNLSAQSNLQRARKLQEIKKIQNKL